MAKRIQGAFGLMTERQREVFRLHREGHSIRRIAAILGISKGSVQQRLEGARKNREAGSRG